MRKNLALLGLILVFTLLLGLQQIPITNLQITPPAAEISKIQQSMPSTRPILEIWNSEHSIYALTYDNTTSFLLEYSAHFQLLDNLSLPVQINKTTVAKLDIFDQYTLGLYLGDEYMANHAIYLTISLKSKDTKLSILTLPKVSFTTSHYAHLNGDQLTLAILGYQLQDQPQRVRNYLLYSYQISISSNIIEYFPLLHELAVITPAESLRLLKGDATQQPMSLILEYQGDSEHQLITYQLRILDSQLHLDRVATTSINCSCRVLNPIQLTGVDYNNHNLTYFDDSSSSSWAVSNSSELKFWRSATDDNGTVFSVTHDDGSNQTSLLLFGYKGETTVELHETEIKGLQQYEHSVIQSIVRVDSYVILKLFQIKDNGRYYLLRVDIGSITNPLVYHLSIPIIGIFLAPGLIFVMLHIFKPRKNRTAELYPKFHP